MRLTARLVCALVGHQPSGGRVIYDTTAESFVDVATTEYAACTRCGDVRPAPLAVVDTESATDGNDDRDGRDRTVDVENDETAR